MRRFLVRVCCPAEICEVSCMFAHAGSPMKVRWLFAICGAIAVFSSAPGA